MKRTPLKRKTSLRESYAKKQLQRYQDGEGRIGMRRSSKSREKKMAQYYRVRSEFLANPENQQCAVCRILKALNEVPAIQRATEVHHMRGRIGRLLTWEPGFCPTCRDHREWPHQNPRRARDYGLLAEMRDWNVFPC